MRLQFAIYFHPNNFTKNLMNTKFQNHKFVKFFVARKHLQTENKNKKAENLSDETNNLT